MSNHSFTVAADRTRLVQRPRVTAVGIRSALIVLCFSIKVYEQTLGSFFRLATAVLLSRGQRVSRSLEDTRSGSVETGSEEQTGVVGLFSHRLISLVPNTRYYALLFKLPPHYIFVRVGLTLDGFMQSFLASEPWAAVIARYKLDNYMESS